MREPGSDGNLNVIFFQKISDNMLKSECPRKSKSGKLPKIDFLLTKHIEGNLFFEVFSDFHFLGHSLFHYFTWNLLENMMNRFPHIPDFSWICHALPLKYNCIF